MSTPAVLLLAGSTLASGTPGELLLTLGGTGGGVPYPVYYKDITVSADVQEMSVLVDSAEVTIDAADSTINVDDPETTIEVPTITVEID